MGPPFRSRIQKTEHAGEAHWLTPSEEIQEDAIIREDYDFNFFVDYRGLIMIDYLVQGKQYVLCKRIETSASRNRA
jgi:hypothetical protein